MNLDPGGEDVRPLPEKRGGRATRRMVRDRCLDAGVDVPVLLKMPGLEGQDGRARARTDGLQPKTEIRAERRALEDPPHFFRDI